MRFRKLKMLPKSRRHGPREKPGIHIYILPNLLTTGNLFFGFYSIVHSLKGQYLLAAYAIVAAAVFDVLDGRVARLTHATSKFGVEYDSMSDLISFGMAPSLLLYKWSLEPFGRIGWLACFLFLACGAMRLARFNVQVGKVEKKYFQGLPIPMAAGIVATSVMAANDLGLDATKNIFILAMTFLLGITMVSNFRYHSFKELDLKERKPFFMLIVALCVIVWVASKPEVNLFILFISYTLLGALFGIFGPARRKVQQIIIPEKYDLSKTKEQENEKSH